MLLHSILVYEYGWSTFFFVGRHRCYPSGKLKQSLDSNILLRGNTEYRVSLTLAYTDAQPLADFVLCETSGFKEFLHEGIVIFGRLLNKLLTGLFRSVHKIRRNFKVFTRTVLVLKMIVFHSKYIHESVE